MKLQEIALTLIPFNYLHMFVAAHTTGRDLCATPNFKLKIAVRLILLLHIDISAYEQTNLIN
jgi:hypothetical protein